MKHTLRKLVLAALALCLLATVASAALGGAMYARGTMLSDTVSLINGSWTVTDEKGNKGGVLENYFVYEQEPAVKPMIAYGNTLYGRSSMAEIARKINADGYTVVAGINGSFFDLNTGIPYGLVVTDGVLRSSGSTAAVGFYADGTAIIGEPNLKITLNTASGSWDTFYNKALSQANGVGLYSGDYDNRTKNSLDAYHVILQPMEGEPTELKLNSRLVLEVTGIQQSVKSCEIPEGGFVLCIAENTLYPTALAGLQALEIGDAVTVTTQIDTAWATVSYAVGGGDVLVENGAARDTFQLDSAKKSAARTAIGIKADGSLVLYTVDGGSTSKGLTLPELAQRMLEAGCRTALNLDGGGSTTAGALYPGYLGNTTVNKPEDGTLRACANFIFLVRKTETVAQDANKLFLYPYDNQPVLPGARLTLTVKAVDRNYTPTVLPGDVTYSARNGTVNAFGTLTVDPQRDPADPTVSVTAQSGGVSGTVQYTVLEDVSTISVRREGKSGSFTKAMLAGGSSIELSAIATYCGMSVTAQDTCFTWAVTGDIGTISADGTFHAAETTVPKTGSIVVSYGRTRTEVIVTIAPADPFSDMKGHWAKEAVNDLYFAGILAGSTGASGKQVYRPDDSMTRQEFLVALIRFLGVDPDDYAQATLPFDDADKIASWALNSVKAAYELKYLGGSASGGKLLANPTSSISRQEAMTILARTQTLPEVVSVAVLNKFSDAGKVADWALTPVAAMVQMEVIGGSNGKLNPTGKVTRAEVAKMLHGLWDDETEE